VLLGCTKPAGEPPAPPPAPVTVVVAAEKTVPVRLRTIGTVKSLASVSIRPRVGGQLTEVFFREGDYVKNGQKLFAIDPRPYDAAVKQAEANLAKNVALLKGAELELKRAESARASGVGAATEYDAALTAVASARAAVEADRAALNTAKLQAGFTTINSPIDGRAGELLIAAGNLVEANGTSPLVVINQLSPISVSFTLPEQHLPLVVEAQKKAPLRVEADLRGGGPLAEGKLEFIDNAADPLSGTVQFKARFENADHKLWPGLFVDVVLTLGQRPNSVVVPSSALQSGQRGQHVYVVTAEKKAELRPVEVAFEDEGVAVIARGLKAGDVVVIEGQLRLTNGTRVEATPFAGRPGGPPPAPTQAPPAATGATTAAGTTQRPSAEGER
jgi:multidrug efflux system membrane fusion protein